MSTIRALDEAPFVRLPIPRNMWAVMTADEKRDAVKGTIGEAVALAMMKHPNGLYKIEMSELHPDPKELLDLNSTPTVTIDVSVIVYEPQEAI